MGSYANAVANVGSQKCRILWVGDSLLEGQGASTLANRPPSALLDLLRTRYSVSESGGVPVHRFYNGGDGSTSWALPGTVSDASKVVRDENYSLSKRGMGIAAANYWIAPTPSHPYRYVEVTYTEHTGLGMSGGCLLVDTAGPTSLMSIDTTAGDTGPKRAIYDYGSSGIRTVGLNPQTGGAYMDAIAFHQTHPDTGAGFASADSTCAGIGSNAMLSGSAPWMGWAQAGADLVIDDLWHNDAVAASATPSVSASRLADRVGRYRAIRADIDIVLVMLWNVPAFGPNDDLGLGYSLNDYRTALLAQAASLNIKVLNLADYEASPPSGWFRADGVHHNDTGYAQWLGHLDTFLHTEIVDPTILYPSKWAAVNITVPEWTPPPAPVFYPSPWVSGNAAVPSMTAVNWWKRSGGVRSPLWDRKRLTAAQQRSLLNWGEFFPDASTTGVYDESVLTEQGATTFSTPSQVVTDKWFRGRVTITAPGVRFRNCKFTGPTDTPDSDGVITATGSNVSSLVFEDCTMYPELPSHVTNVFIGHHATFRRCNAYNGVDIIGAIGDLSSDFVDITVEGSWLHDMVMFNTDQQVDNLTHNDLIQWHGLRGVKILGSRLNAECDPTKGVAATPPVGTWPDSLVSGNPFYPKRYGTSVVMGSPARKFMGDFEMRKSWFDGGAVGLNFGGPDVEVFPDGGIVDSCWFGYDWRHGPDFGILTKAERDMVITNNHRWNPSNPWDTSIEFNVRKNG